MRGLANVEEDSPEWHAFDTVKGGDYLVDQPAAEIMCEEAVEAVYELEHWGLPFNRTPDGKLDQRRFGGHTRNHGEAAVRRAVTRPTAPAIKILQTLYQQCIKRDVRFFNEFYVLDLIMDEGVCGGVVAYELATGEIHVFRAKAVLFATGGYGRTSRSTSNAHALTGDGPAVVWRNGLPLEDMEFFQFHPTGIYKIGILLSEAVRGEGGILRNDQGERFMERYAPTVKDLAPRDMVSRAIFTEVKEGRGIDGKDFVHLDVTHLPPEVVEEKLPDVTEFARIYLGVEPLTEGVPIQPDRALRDGRHPHQHRRTGRHRPRRNAHPRAVRGWRMRLRERARSEPTRHQLAARHRRVRSPRRPSHDGVPEREPGEPARVEHPETEVVNQLEGLLASSGNQNPADIREAMQVQMTDLAGVIRTEESLTKLTVSCQAFESDTPEPLSRTRARSTTPTSWRRWNWASSSTVRRP